MPEPPTIKDTWLVVRAWVVSAENSVRASMEAQEAGSESFVRVLHVENEGDAHKLINGISNFKAKEDGNARV